jgi:hypothetical protein
MTATLDHLYASARTLPSPDMGWLVTRLLGDLSNELPDTTDAEFEAIADAREAEMDMDADATVSHEEMLRFIESKRR